MTSDSKKIWKILWKIHWPTQSQHLKHNIWKQKNWPNKLKEEFPKVQSQPKFSAQNTQFNNYSPHAVLQQDFLSKHTKVSVWCDSEMAFTVQKQQILWNNAAI